MVLRNVWYFVGARRDNRRKTNDKGMSFDSHWLSENKEQSKESEQVGLMKYTGRTTSIPTNLTETSNTRGSKRGV
jgi:hypothetical protein